MEEFPLRLPIGLQQLKNHHDPELIKLFTNILGSLMQGTDGHVVDYLKRRDYPSTISLTVNHRNLTRNPKLDNHELKQWPIKHRPLIMQMVQNSANILCINEADSFCYPEEDKTIDLIKLFNKCGYKGIVLKLWSSPSHALSEMVSTPESNYWHVTLQPRANVGVLHSACSDASSDSRGH